MVDQVFEFLQISPLFSKEMDAKNMNDVLSDERMWQVTTENVWRYLAVIYVGKTGMNLRNDLSHGLLSPVVFNKGVADRVFHMFLVLSMLRFIDAKKALMLRQAPGLKFPRHFV